MVMGPTHAMSGAALGLTIAAIAPSWLGAPSTPVGALTYAAITAGAALLPDIDSPQATVSRTFGFASIGLSHACENASLAVHSATRTPRDSELSNGHRTATHTVWFALAIGVVCGLLVALFGKTAAVAILFVMMGLALRGLFPAWVHKTDWVAVTATAGLIAFAVWKWQPQVAGPVALGGAITVGVLAHLAGDFLTKNGVPLLGGIVSVNGKRWWDFCPPAAFRITANGPWDKALLGVFTALTGLLVWLTLVDPAAMGAQWPAVV